MRMRLKILSGFFILVLMLSIAGVWSIYELKYMSTSVQELLDDNYKSIYAAKIMVEALEREDSGILLLLLGNFHKGRTIITSADSLFENGFYIAANNITIPSEQTFIDSIKIKYQNYKKLWEKPIVDTQKQGNLNWYLNSVHESFLDLKSDVNSLMTINDQAMFSTASNLKDKANRAIMPGIVAIISAIVFTLLFNFFVNYYFTNPIIKINKSIRQFLDRRVSFKVEIETKDEISELADSINALSSLVKN